MDDPDSLPILASVVFVRIADFTRRPVAEQARLRSQLESAIAVSLLDVPDDCRIMLDAPDGMAVAVLRNPVAALDVGERCAGVAAIGIGLAVGINHGAIRLAEDDSGHPGLIGDSIGIAAAIADFAGTGRLTVSRSFADALREANPARAASLRRAGTFTDRQVRSHELLTVDRSAPARRRRILAAVGTIVAIVVIGGGVVVRDSTHREIGSAPAGKGNIIHRLRESLKP